MTEVCPLCLGSDREGYGVVHSPECLVVAPEHVRQAVIADSLKRIARVLEDELWRIASGIEDANGDGDK